MSPHRRRWTLGVLVAAVLLLGAAFVVRTFVLNDQARAVPTAEVVDRFRADNTTTTTASIPATSTAASSSSSSTTIGEAAASSAVGTSMPSEPRPIDSSPIDTSPIDASPIDTSSPATPPTVVADLVRAGVYTYETTGSEQIDAVGGARHTYPDSTTITVLPDGCGVSLRLDLLRERWEEWGICATSNGIELQADGVQYHEFFGRSERERLRCDGGALLVSASEPPATPTEQVCTLGGDPWLPIWTVLERSTRTIDGAEIEVQRVQMRIEDDDEYWEQIVLDWYLAPNGLPVEVKQTKSSRSATFVGPVEYAEEYHLVLTSMDPLR